MSEQGRQTTTGAVSPLSDGHGASSRVGRDSGSGDRSIEGIEADIEATRERLAGTIDAIGDRVQPANVARRATDAAKAQVVEPDGRVRVERVAIAAGVLVTLIALRIWRARRRS
ncbi:MAG: DUF3618 domain-containing protein [Actinomycetota bacterium]|nr:DUF3618 domain-containing protein [Actinomycetota bacterium]